jgi:peptide/nickel transport system permease protein
MLRRLARKPLFWIGFFYIFLWLAGSFAYLWIGHNHMPIADLTYDSHGRIAARPPYPPWQAPPLGADDFARSIFIVVLIGAKFTLGFAILIAWLRAVLAGIIGIAFRLWIPKIGRLVLAPFESLSYFPIALLAFFILQWVLFQDARMHDNHFTYGFLARTWITVAVLTLIALPAAAQTFYNETDHLMQKEFMESAKVLGGGRWHLFRNHLRPYLFPRFVLVFVREIIQVLLLMAHLGLFNLAIGGMLLKESLFSTQVPPKLYPYSLSNEWGGLIGAYWHFLWTTYPYLALIPIVLVTLAILSVKAVLLAVQQIVEKDHEYPTPKPARSVNPQLKKAPQSSSLPSEGEEAMFLPLENRHA